MSSHRLTVTWRLAGQIAAEDQDAWSPLITTFANEIAHPGQVELVITDHYQTVVGEYSIRSPIRANPDMTATDYQAVKPDGAMAAAKTVDLPDDKAAVLVSTGVIRLGAALASRILRHEAEHVRLLQRGEETYGIHRKVAFELPDDLSYDFVWIAESVISELRCERALHELGTYPNDLNSEVADHDAILESFESVRRSFRRSGDVLAAYQGATSVLDRLAQHLAYGAAFIAANPQEAARWSSISSMAELVGIVSELPGAHREVSLECLADNVIQVARLLRKILQDNGFDSYNQPDGSLYFEALW